MLKLTTQADIAKAAAPFLEHKESFIREAAKSLLCLLTTSAQKLNTSTLKGSGGKGRLTRSKKRGQEDKDKDDDYRPGRLSKSTKA